MFRTTILTLAIVSQFVGLGSAIFGLSTCGSRCYDLTATLIGCETTDYQCHCSGFQRSFRPQWDTCRIEGCAFETGGISAEELRNSVCAAAQGTSGSPTTQPTTQITTTATSEASRTPTPEISTVSSSGQAAPTITASAGGSRSSEQGARGLLALGLLAAGLVL